MENFQHELRGIIPRTFEYLFNHIDRQKQLVRTKCSTGLQRNSRIARVSELSGELFFTGGWKCPILVSMLLSGNLQRTSVRPSRCCHPATAFEGKHQKGCFCGWYHWTDGHFCSRGLWRERFVLIEGFAMACWNMSGVRQTLALVLLIQTLSVGQMNRTVASTSMNRESSRSHGVFTLSVDSKASKAQFNRRIFCIVSVVAILSSTWNLCHQQVNRNGVWTVKSSVLNLVDLAGSERQKDTNTDGQRLKEGCSINKSLSALGNVMMALVKNTKHVPYRDSKLTFLLRVSTGPQQTVAKNSEIRVLPCSLLTVFVVSTHLFHRIPLAEMLWRTSLDVSTQVQGQFLVVSAQNCLIMFDVTRLVIHK